MLRRLTMILLMLFLVQTQSMYYVKEGKDNSPLSSYDQTISSPDGTVSVTIPCSWSSDEGEKDEGLLLDLNSNNHNQYISVYYLNGNTVEECTFDLKEYYGSEIIGKEKMFVINGADGFMLEYRHVGTTINDEEALFHGYRYFFRAPHGVIEFDAYRTFVGPDADQTATDSELSTMKRIAESLVIDTTSELFVAPSPQEGLPEASAL